MFGAISSISRSQAAPPRVVIVGAGFGGLWAAKTLANAPVEVVVIDRENYHLFQPLLYQVATAGLSPADGLTDPQHRRRPPKCYRHAG
jgi:NADH:ubiquinone reductase (H+-translocating)